MQFSTVKTVLILTFSAVINDCENSKTKVHEQSFNNGLELHNNTESLCVPRGKMFDANGKWNM